MHMRHVRGSVHGRLLVALVVVIACVGCDGTVRLRIMRDCKERAWQPGDPPIADGPLRSAKTARIIAAYHPDDSLGRQGPTYLTPDLSAYGLEVSSVLEMPAGMANIPLVDYPHLRHRVSPEDDHEGRGIHSWSPLPGYVWAEPSKDGDLRVLTYDQAREAPEEELRLIGLRGFRTKYTRGAPDGSDSANSPPQKWA